MRSKKNAGFSLVELIIVIAIMAILVGVLAPQFIKYVESSRRSTDIQNAEALKEAMLAEMADQSIDGIAGSGTLVMNAATIALFDGSSLMAASISADSIPTIQGNLANKGGYFYVSYDVVAGKCDVYNADPSVVASTTYCLTNAVGADEYKNAR